MIDAVSTRSKTTPVIRKALEKVAYHLGFQVTRVHRRYPVRKAIDPICVAVLADPDFRQSCEVVATSTLLDTSRLANLWQLCRMTNPAGSIIEIGTYKGGGALHLSNSAPARKIVICDSFAGFANVDPLLDSNFHSGMFKDTGIETVTRLFRNTGRNFEIIPGFFPDSCSGRDVGRFSFAHLDVDVYKSTIESLHFLRNKMMERSLIILDDYHRQCEGVDRAVREFTATAPEWQAFPLFPGQGLLVHQSWFEHRPNLP